MAKDLQDAELISSAPLIAEPEVLMMPVIPPNDGFETLLSSDLDGVAVDAALFESETMLLELADLLPDSAGDIVLFAGEDLPVNLVTSEKVAAVGIVEEYVTASGVNVAGHTYYSFESGVTVYSAGDLVITGNIEIR